MNVKLYNHATGEVRTLTLDRASQVTRSDSDWSFDEPLPAGWDREIPRYKATKDLRAEKQSARVEKPFTYQGDFTVWQYGSAPIVAGQEVQTSSWPHPSFQPLNETAKRIHSFFSTHQKSRMQLSPWRAGRLHLDDGMSFNEMNASQIAAMSLQKAAAGR